MIDSHAHVTDSAFDSDREAVLQRARVAGVRWIEIGTSVADSEGALKLASEVSDVILGATVGIHPNEITPELDWSAIETVLNHERTLAVGEVGLDYHHTSPFGLRGAGRGETNRDYQLTILAKFVKLAGERGVPVVFHVRSGQDADAHDDMLNFLHALPEAQRPAGVMHTFSGTWEQAQEYLQLGLYLSISGVVTFKKALDMHEVARQAPLNRLLIETDSPYLTPEPHRGERNEPAYVEFVARKIAELRGVSFEEVATTTEKNALSLFKLS